MSSGAVSAALAFVWWGLFPLYFRIVTTVPAAEVLAHRVVWCLVFLAGVLSWRRQWAWLPRVLHEPKTLGAFAGSALLIGCNWLIYIWSVGHQHVVDASLGYFITPLVNVLLGTTLLGERLRPLQWTALAVAGIGVAWLTWQAGHPPWIALALAASFGAYGLLRKVASLGALEGLALETLLLTPIAAVGLVFWAVHGDASFPSDDWHTSAWLVAFGPMTAVPLLLFATAARSLSMTTLGLMQYIGPTIQLVVALFVFGEPFPAAQAVGFGCIWIALALYSAEGWRYAVRRRPEVLAG